MLKTAADVSLLEVFMKYRLLIMVGAFLFAAACNEDARQARGFSLPEGDIANGQQVFIDKRCNDCHVVGDVVQQANEEPEYSIKLGGKVASIQTYGDLVTSIINPSHRVAKKYADAGALSVEGESAMRSYNDVMSVQELVDVVTFLRSEYELLPPPTTVYRSYYPYH